MRSCDRRLRGRHLLFVLLLLTPQFTVSRASTKAQQLMQLRDDSSHGVLEMDTRAFETYTDGSARPYGLLVFCNAAQMKQSTQIKLPELMKSFRTAAAHVRRAARKPETRTSANKVFFVELEWSRSSDVFQKLGVQSLPWVVYIGSSVKHKAGGAWTALPKSSRMKVEDYPVYPWTASDFLGFVKARTGVDFGEPHVERVTDNPVIVGALVLALAPLAWLGWKVYTSSWIGHPLIWTCAVLSVYAFATSGGLFNIIRGVPLVSVNHHGKVEWYKQAPGQLGMEGFTVGGMYLAMAVTVVTLMAGPRLFGHWRHFRVISYILLAMACLLMMRIVDFFKWKMDYRLRFYLCDWLPWLCMPSPFALIAKAIKPR